MTSTKPQGDAPDAAPQTPLQAGAETPAETPAEPEAEPEAETPAESGDIDSLIAEARTLLAHQQSPDPEAFADPLAFIRDDHARQLRMCNILDAFTEKLELEPVMPLASALAAYLKGDLPLHILDEEKDLRPALQDRCKPEDGLDDVLKKMSKEHALNDDLVSFLIDDLEALADGRTLSNPVRLLMNVREFSETQRQHITWEDRVLLPLARQRLSDDDLARIGRNMAKRREETEAETG